MNPQLFQETGFQQIKDEIESLIISDFAKEDFRERTPSTHLQTVTKRLTETEEAMLLLASGQHVPFMGMTNIKRLTEKIQRGLILEPEDLLTYSDFLRSFGLIKKLFTKNQYQLPTLYRYTRDLGDFAAITQEIEASISGSRVKDDSSRMLRKIRSQIHQLEAEIQHNLDKFTKNPLTAKYLQDRLVIIKDDRYTLPVKSEFQSKINGTIVERSAKGNTVFMEPASVAKANEKLVLAKAEEVAEVYQILASLTGLLAENLPTIQYSREILGELDIILARGKYARSINAKPLTVNNQDELRLDQVKNPLLGAAALPLSISLGVQSRGIVITGPNAGGKTVVLRTVALVCLLAAMGIPVNGGPQTTVPLLQEIFIDVGDQQDLGNALSTFSGHMQHVSQILAAAKPHTLVLLDEIGSGTEPKEGAALGIALMTAMYRKGAMVIATTHYGEIKDFALQHEDFRAAAMQFDSKTLQPTYRLLMDQVGDSNAFFIAENKGIPTEVIQYAADILKKQPLDTQQLTFKKVPSPKEAPPTTSPVFSKGDRVRYNETGAVGLFFQQLTENEGEIYLDKEMLTVPLRRLTLEMPATQLYPADYDLETLFTDFHERKFQRDIDRGSKKAQKRLRKMAEARQQH